MVSTIFKLGNSNAIRLPKAIMKALNFSTNDEISMETKDNMLIISKHNGKKSIKELFVNYDKEYFADETFDDGPKGREML